MTVEPRPIDKLREENQQARRLSVVYKDSTQNAVTITAKEAVWLGRDNMITPVFNRRGDYIVYLKAATSVHAIHRALKGYRLPVLPSSVITKPIQASGAQHWVTRLDRAPSGLIGSRRQLWF